MYHWMSSPVLSEGGVFRSCGTRTADTRLSGEKLPVPPGASLALREDASVEHRRMEPMNEPTDPVTVALRIPGKWSNPGELAERLPPGCRLTAEGLVVPDGKRVECGAMKADNQFAQIFRSSCREPATAEELATVAGYTVNVILQGPGGSLPAARAMMQAG